jgi:hypothetical protein
MESFLINYIANIEIICFILNKMIYLFINLISEIIFIFSNKQLLLNYHHTHTYLHKIYIFVFHVTLIIETHI